MKNRKLYLFAALFVILISMGLLVSGSPLLTLGLDEADTVPLGTFTTWAGLIALPVAVYFSVKVLREPSGKWYGFLSGFLKFIALLAVLWVPISYLLAGNMSFSFSSANDGFRGSPLAYVWFKRFTLGIVYGALAALVFHWVTRLIMGMKSRLK